MFFFSTLETGDGDAAQLDVTELLVGHGFALASPFFRALVLKSISWQTLPAPQQPPPLAGFGFLNELVVEDAEEVLLTMVPILNAGNQLEGKRKDTYWPKAECQNSLLL